MLGLAALIFALSLLPQLAHAGNCTDDLGCALNEVRIAHGLSPLAVSPALTLAAQQYAEEMAERGVLTHQSADGDWPWDRAADAGHDDPWVAEVLAETTGDDADDADVLRGLLHSTPHRAILLDSSYQVVGIGVSEGNGRRWYVADVGRVP